MGLLISLVLFTLPNPTLLGLIPNAILLSVTALSLILFSVITLLVITMESAVPLISPAIFRMPFVVEFASEIVLFELLELFELFPPANTAAST